MKIAVTGGKGGTGKSTVATSLAFELSKRGKVLLVDADVDCPNDHLLLSIKRDKVKDVYQEIPKWDFFKCSKSGKCSEVCKMKAVVFVKGRYPVFIPEQCSGCGACMIACPGKAIGKTRKNIGIIYSGSGNGIDLVTGELIPGEMISDFVVDDLKEYFTEREKDYDYVIVDTAAGTHCGVINSITGCDIAIAVTEPTPLGAHDLGLMLDLLKIIGVTGKVVLNRSDIGDCKLIEEMAKKQGTEIISRIPYSKSIMESYSRGEPVKDSRIKELAEFAEGLK
ncbi:MAG: ATP-binding protein [Candidatus Aenigmarchaeota archaeon]|nr:ATP-binding protein [Candidatus Aenigmarchaeota archaeon]